MKGTNKIKNKIKTKITKNKFLFVILIIISMLILFGCKGGTTGSPGGVAMSYEEVHTGKDGLVMEFIKEMPPGQVTEGSDFNIGLKLENKGAYEIKKDEGKVSISGLNPEYFAFTAANEFSTGIMQPFAIEGKTPYNSKGGIEYLYFIIKSKKFTGFEKGRKLNDTVLARATACFKYKTEAGANLCIKPQVEYTGTEKGDACEVKPITFSGGQGAPIGITKIEPSILLGPNYRHDLKLKIYVKNFGDVAKTHVFPPEAYGGDAPCTDYNAEGRIPINSWDIKISGIPVDGCRQDKIRLSKKREAFFECEFTHLDVSTGAYVAPLTISLDYAYSFDATKPIAIRKEQTDEDNRYY